MRKNSVKNVRINGEVKRVLAEILKSDIKDPRIGELVSVLSAEVATDLKTCKVHISVLGEEAEREETLQGLLSAEGFIRGQLAKKLNLRNTPALQFIMDDSIAYGVSMSKRIEEVQAQDEAARRDAKQAQDADAPDDAEQ